MATSFHRKPGVTAEQIRAKRQELLHQLHAPAHADNVVTREYGGHDPRIVPLPACECGKSAVLKQLRSGKWSAGCKDCGNKIRDPQQTGWSASLQWCQLNAVQMDYGDLPLFDLRGLDHAQAKARLTSIYGDLLLRSQIATLDRELNTFTEDHPAPGQEYADRLFAYRDWAKLALGLVKLSAAKQGLKAQSASKGDSPTPQPTKSEDPKGTSKGPTLQPIKVLAGLSTRFRAMFAMKPKPPRK